MVESMEERCDELNFIKIPNLWAGLELFCKALLPNT